MSGVTNRLIEDYKKVRQKITDSEYDVILSTGEQHSAAIVSTFQTREKSIQDLFLDGKFSSILTVIIAVRILEINSDLIKTLLKKIQSIGCCWVSGYFKRSQNNYSWKRWIGY